jgi:aspartyl-tRNA(Asn)/glutamyl-tRNA(Gln) amidotransferase subunit A
LRPSNNTKSIVAAEAYHLHQSNLEAGKGDQYDPLIAFRIQGGKDILASEYIEMFATRKRIWAAVQTAVRGYDALILPTSPALPPAYHRLAIFRPRPRKMPNAFAIRPSLTILTGQQSPFPAIRQALALLVFRLSDHASMTAGYWRLPPQASRSSAARSHQG